MKKITVFSIVTIALFLSACNGSSDKSEPTDTNSGAQVFNLDTTKLKSAEVFYQCPMDLEVISDKTGNCPKCGMELEKLEKK